MKKEGWYCRRCGEYLGETGNDDMHCACTGDVEYREWNVCPHCGDGDLTAQSDWTCPDGCDLKHHNED